MHVIHRDDNCSLLLYIVIVYVQVNIDNYCVYLHLPQNSEHPQIHVKKMGEKTKPQTPSPSFSPSSAQA